MNIFLNDPDEVRLPPEEVRLRSLQAIAYPQGDRVRVHLELTPFARRPNIKVTVNNSQGIEMAGTTILETMLSSVEFTMHLRQPEPDGEYTIVAEVYYQQLPEPSDKPMDLPLPPPLIVDRKAITFRLPGPGT